MPISPENKSRYPKNWPEIREEIRLRAANKCELCGVKNRVIGFRDSHGKFYHHYDIEMQSYIRNWKPKMIEIVCTVMHLDHQPENNGTPGNRPNLKFGCQKCHNNYDKDHRAKNRKITHDKKIASNQKEV